MFFNQSTYFKSVLNHTKMLINPLIQELFLSGWETYFSLKVDLKWITKNKSLIFKNPTFIEKL